MINGAHDESGRRAFSRKRAVAVGVAGVAAFVVGGAAHGVLSYPFVNGHIDVRPKRPGTIRVAVFNARRATLSGVPGRLKDVLVDLRAAIAVCRNLDADVLSIAEIDRRTLRSHLRHQPRSLARALDMQCVYAPTVFGGPHHPDLGMGDRGDALLTRGIPVGLPEIHPLSYDTASRRGEPRSFIIRKVELNGVTVYACGTHLGVSSPDEALNQLREICKLLQEKKKQGDFRVLLPGDFNLPPGHIEALLAEFPDLDLVRVPNLLPTYKSNEMMPDHIVYSGSGFRLIANERVCTPISDHYLLYADLQPL